MTRPALANRGPADPRAMILAPTRELAIQIHKDAEKFCAGLGLKFALIYGGVDYDKQRAQLTSGCDVIIATPGRLIDYVRQGVVHLHACEVCILDEADRMFDLGFIKDLRFLLRKLPRREERQTLMFSATLSHRVLELAYEHMNEPEKVIVETETITASRVRQVVYFPSNEEKLPLLISLLSRTEANRTMVFVNTKAWVERVGRALEKAGYRVGVLSGDVPQKKRQSLLAKFQRARTRDPGRHRRRRPRPAHRRGQPRLQLRPAVRCRGLRAPHRPHRAPGHGRRRGQLRLRDLRAVAAGDRGLHRAEDPGRGGDRRIADARFRARRARAVASADGEAEREHRRHLPRSPRRGTGQRPRPEDRRRPRRSRRRLAQRPGRFAQQQRPAQWQQLARSAPPPSGERAPRAEGERVRRAIRTPRRGRRAIRMRRRAAAGPSAPPSPRGAAWPAAAQDVAPRGRTSPPARRRLRPARRRPRRPCPRKASSSASRAR